MEPNKEGLEPQKNPEGGVPQTPTVTLSQTEIDDLQRRADASSQNYERLKKLETELEIAKAEKELLESNYGSPEQTGTVDAELRTKVSELESKWQKQEVIGRHPELKEMWNELEEFRNNPDNKGMNLNTAAKAFMIEKGLTETPRQGLEKTTGGPRTPVQSGMTTEEAANLRTTNFKLYSEKLRKGQINI
jgi:hypothetical protein